MVADGVELFESLEGADLVITGEGFLDEQSFEGKVVGGVVDLAAEVGVPVLAVVGQVFDGADDRVRASYGAKYDRLADIKWRYDPDNLFHRNVNIKPAAAPAGS